MIDWLIDYLFKLRQSAKAVPPCQSDTKHLGCVHVAK